MIQSIKITLTNTVTEAKINNDFSEYFEGNTVVRQVYPLSAILFSIVIDKIIRKLDVRHNISVRLKQICADTDDVLI